MAGPRRGAAARPRGVPRRHAVEVSRESGLDLPDVYDGSRGWSDLCEAAGVPIAPAGAHEKPLRRAIGRLLHIDDDERIATYRRLLGVVNAA